ncbi:unnamed protein product, partial [Rotaria sp. Silwood1]
MVLFYRLRQKKKQRRLQHGPLPVRHHQQHVEEIKRHNQEQKMENKLITAIVGSSIARNISVKNIENETNEVRLRFKSGSDCADALSWLESTDGQFFMRGVNQLVFILDTNDIYLVGAFQTVERIDYTIEKIRRSYPGTPSCKRTFEDFIRDEPTYRDSIVVHIRAVGDEDHSADEKAVPRHLNGKARLEVGKAANAIGCLKRHPWKNVCSDVTFTCGSGSGYTKECFCIGRTCPDGCDSDRDCCTATVDGIRYVGYCLERFNSAYCRYRPSF